MFLSVHGKQPCDLHEKARDQAHQQQNSGKNNQRISIASPILTGVGMPAWKAAKMRVFFKTQECHWFRLKRYLCSQRLFVSVQQKDPAWGLFARYSAAYPYSNRCLPIMQLLFGHLMTAAKNPPRRSHLRSGRRFRCPTHPQPASWPPPNLRPRSGPPSSGAQR